MRSAWKDKFDSANQLVSSTTDGVTTRYEYDAAGRLVKEGNRNYTYGYLDKVMSVRDGKNKFSYTYHPDGQLASANYGDSSESFTWDGLALIQRGDEHFLNEPHVGGGNPVVSSKGTLYFNDMLGTTVGAKSGKTYSAATLSAFGEDLTHHCPPPPTFSTSSSFFTGKPQVAGLGHAFLMRNYRADLAKRQTVDPMGYPDGWNAMAYCGNGVTGCVDLWGCATVDAAIIDGGKTIGGGGTTRKSDPVINANSADHTLSAYFQIQISTGSGNKHSSSYMVGSTATYRTHNGNPDDSSLTPITEAVYAHEYGHAQYLQTTFRLEYEKALTQLEVEWINSGWSKEEALLRAYAAYYNVYQNCLEEVCNAVNSPTVGWFQSSPYWKFVSVSEIKDANGQILQYEYVWRRVAE